MLPGKARAACVAGIGLFKGMQYIVAKMIAQQGLYIHSGLTLSTTQLEIICGAVKKPLG